MTQFKVDITISTCRASIFSCDMTMISYFNIIINKNIIPNPAFNKLLKIFVIFFIHYKFWEMLYNHIITVFAFFNHTVNKMANSIFTQVWLKSLTELIINTHHCHKTVRLDTWAVFIEFLKYVGNSGMVGTDLLKWLQRVKNFWLAMTLKEFWQL